MMSGRRNISRNTGLKKDRIKMKIVVDCSVID